MQLFDEGIAKGQVNAFLKDLQGNIWVAHDFGLSVYRQSFSRFMNFTHDRAYPNLPGVLISDGNRLVAFAARHLSKFDIATRLSQQDSLQVPPDYKYPSYVFRHNSLGYVSFCNNHFFATHTTSLAITNLPVKPTGFAFNKIGHFRVMDCIPVELYGKNLWLLHGNIPYGTMLLLYDPLTGEIWEETRLDNQRRPMISKMIRTPDGRFWISTIEAGIYISENESLKNLRNLTQASTNGALPTNNISDLLADGTVVWATLYGVGLMRIEPKPDGTFRFEFFNKGLDDPFLFRLVPYGKDKIWITGLNGLLCFDKKTGSFRRFSLNNGIRNTKFQLFDTFHGTCGNSYLYFSDRANLIIFQPDSVLSQAEKPRLILSGIESGSAIYNSIYNTIAPEFNYNDNTLAFTYDVLNYENEQNLRVKYKLEGFDKEWAQTKDFSKIIYRQLPHGHYRFAIQLLPADTGAMPTQHFSFVIATPWFKRWWFYGLCGAATILLVYALYRYRLGQKLRILQIRNRLHRDLHDDVGATLSSVKAYSEILKDGPDGKLIAQLIRDNSSDMLERLEVISWATDPDHDNFNSLKNKMMKFAVLCHSKNIAFTMDSSGISDTIILSGEIRQAILLVFKEAINNVIKYAGSTACTVHLFIRNNQFEMSIADNGNGFDGAIKGTGHGLKNMKKRSEDLKGSLTITSTSGKGTCVIMRLPYPFKIPNTWDLRQKKA